MFKKTVVIIIVFLIFTSFFSSAEVFRFRHVAGDKYRIISQVEEDVYFNGFYSHSAEILNRIAMEVEDDSEGRGTISGIFQTSERAFGSGTVYEWGREYVSRFIRDNRGYYEIGPEYYMPVVRNVPILPEGDVSFGDSWMSPAEEVHDFRDNLGIEDAFHFPMDVNYTYMGIEDTDEGEVHLISIEYTLFHRPIVPPGIEPGPYFPSRITGYSRQLLYWNSREGRPQAYSEEFDIFFDLLSGDSIEYRGTARAHVVEAVLMDHEELARDIRKELEERGVEDARVRVDTAGVTISLHNIMFPPDSAFLRESEKRKLDEIGGILKTHPGRDILISGHTALAGTPEGRMELSRNRARAVGDYLLSIGSREAEEMVFKGWGAEKPLSGNDTAEGQIQNRRVEITILEN